MKHKEALSVILSEMTQDSVLAGFDPVLALQNIEIMRRLVNGESRASLSVAFRLKPRSIGRMKTRFSRLERVDMVLTDDISTVGLPCVWAESFGIAAKHAIRLYCGHLVLASWRIRDASGNEMRVSAKRGVDGHKPFAYN